MSTHKEGFDVSIEKLHEQLKRIFLEYEDDLNEAEPTIGISLLEAEKSISSILEQL